MEQKDVLNVEEAAEFLSVSPWTIREQARTGRLPARKIGKEWRFSRQALLEWLGSQSPQLERVEQVKQ